MVVIFFFQAEDGIRDSPVTGVQTCALPILLLVIDLNDYKSELEAEVKQMMSRDLTIEDDIKLGFALTNFLSF